MGTAGIIHILVHTGYTEITITTGTPEDTMETATRTASTVIGHRKGVKDPGESRSANVIGFKPRKEENISAAEGLTGCPWGAVEFKPRQGENISDPGVAIWVDVMDFEPRKGEGVSAVEGLTDCP